jgi:tetratricopeptide (TPR) repeat protein
MPSASAEPAKPAAPDPQTAADLAAAERDVRAGRLKDAIALYERVLAREPGHALALNNLGVALRRAGEGERAVQCFAAAVRGNPRNADAHYNLGNALRDAKRYDDAVECYRRALKLNPRYAAAYANLALAHKAAKRPADARRCLAAGLRALPDAALLHLELGILHWEQRRDEAALVHYCKAHALEPANHKILHNIAAALLRTDRYDAAAEVARQAIGAEPNHAETHAVLGQALCALGRLGEAEESLRRALALDAGNLSANLGLARVLLLGGRLKEGWPAYEVRWKRATTPRPQFPKPAWEGEEIKGRTLLLYTEQGFGDTIQFVRYAALLRDRGVRVILMCEPPLVRLLSTVDGIAQVVPRGGTVPDFDRHAALLSVPRILGTERETIPAAIPYIRVAGQAPAARPRRVAGVAWAGSGQHDNDRNRSIALKTLLPALDRPELDFVSLQFDPKGEIAREIAALGAEALLPSAMGRVKDFADTAALMPRLDLVISVDTAVAHLAGAMGRPVWVLLPFAPDWRWMLERADTPWYPTMRLYRQPAPGDWPSVIERVRGDLAEFARSKPNVSASQGQVSNPPRS